MLEEMKRQIMLTSGLIDDSNFDLELSNAQTGEVYKADPGRIARNTSVLVRRVPLHLALCVDVYLF